MNDQQLRIAGAIAGAAAVICAALPWATLGSYSKSGIDGASDGIFTALAGGFGGYIAWRASRKAQRVTIVCAVIVAGVGIYDWIDISNTGFVSVGIGLYGTVLAGLALLGVGVARVKAAEPPPLPPPSGPPVA